MRGRIIIVLLLVLLTGCSAADPITSTVYVNSIAYTGDYWEEVSVPASACATLPPGATESNCQSGFVYLFPDVGLPADETFVYFTMSLPHSYREGTNVVFSPHYVFNTDEVATNIRWKIAYSWANIGDPFPVATNIWILTDPSNNDSTINHVAHSAVVSGAGKEISSTILCYLSRNASDVSDNYTGTAIFTGVSVLYQVDSPGSTSQWVK